MKRSGTRAFFIEGAALTLFVLLAMAVLVQVYGRARSMGTQAARTTAAALILQNVDADFQAGAGDFAVRPAAAQTLTLYYTADGVRDDGGPYCVTAQLTPEPSGAGTVYRAAFTVAYTGVQEPLAALQTACYVGKGAD